MRIFLSGQHGVTAEELIYMLTNTGTTPRWRQTQLLEPNQWIFEFGPMSGIHSSVVRQAIGALVTSGVCKEALAFVSLKVCLHAHMLTRVNPARTR